jgi:mRNA interferase MazF
MIHRGEVWWADLGEPRGSAPALRRPVLIVQAESFNASRLRTAIVVALTTNLRLGAMPGNVMVPSTLSGLPEDSVVNVTQMATVDSRDLDVRAGSLPDWMMDEVDEGLRTVLAL